jgi:hypothetical protein
LKTADFVAEKIVNAFSTPVTRLKGVDISVTPSIGITLYPGDGDTIEALLHAADAAMYDAKAAGRRGAQAEKYRAGSRSPQSSSDILSTSAPSVRRLKRCQRSNPFTSAGPSSNAPVTSARSSTAGTKSTQRCFPSSRRVSSTVTRPMEDLVEYETRLNYVLPKYDDAVC